MRFEYRFAGGLPCTPYDLAASQAGYLPTGRGVLNCVQLNTLQINNFQQFVFRLDKCLNFPRLAPDLFLDVQNAFVLKNPGLPDYTCERLADNSGFATNGRPLQPNGSNAIPTILKTTTRW